MSSTCINSGRVFCHASCRPFGGSGSFRNASSRPTSRSARASRRVGAHAQRDALRRAEEVAEHRASRRWPRIGLFEQQRGTAGLQHAIADLGHLEARIDDFRDAPQLAGRLELGDEVAQVAM